MVALSVTLFYGIAETALKDGLSAKSKQYMF